MQTRHGGTLDAQSARTPTHIQLGISERSGLSKRDRSLITVAMLTALYRHEQLPGHVNRALDNGVTKEELVEVITHATFYSGWPTGAQGATIAAKVFESRGL